MIIYADGWDADTRTRGLLYPIIINTKDVLYARGRDSKGDSTVVYLRHNVIKETDNRTCSDPTWVVLNMSAKDFYEKWKEGEVME